MVRIFLVIFTSFSTLLSCSGSLESKINFTSLSERFSKSSKSYDLFLGKINESSPDGYELIERIDIIQGETLRLVSMQAENSSSLEKVRVDWSLDADVGSLSILTNGYSAEFKALNLGNAKIIIKSQGVEKQYLVKVYKNLAPIISDNEIQVSTDGGSTIIDLLAGVSDEDSESIEITSYNTPENGSFSANPDGTFSYTPNPGFIGVEVISYVVSDGVNEFSGELRLNMLSRFSWTGKGSDNLFNNPDNWCGDIVNNECSGGVVPSASDQAVFTNGCEQCDVNIDQALAVSGILLTPQFSGELSFSNNTHIIGIDGLIQNAGNLQGNSSTIVVDGNIELISGNFYAPNILRGNKLEVTFKVGEQLNFYPQNGQVLIDPTNAASCTAKHYYIELEKELTLHDLNVRTRDTSSCNGYGAGHLEIIPNGNTIIVENDLRILSGTLKNGSINVRGDAYFHYTSDSEAATGGSTKIIFDGSTTQYYLTEIGARASIIELNSPGGSLSPMPSSSIELTLSGLSVIAGDFNASPNGNLNLRASKSSSVGITATGGSMDLSSTHLSYYAVGYNCDPNFSPLSSINPITIASLSINGRDEDCNGGGQFGLDIDPAGITITGDLTIISGVANIGDIYVGGDLDLQYEDAIYRSYGGSSKVILNGSGTQQISQAAGAEFFSGGLEVNKPSGDITLGTSLDFLGEDLLFIAGTLNFSGNDLVGIGTFTEGSPAPTFNRSTELFQYSSCSGGTCTISSD